MQVRSVFWADGRSRDAYKNFGDILVFYVTYNTNSFKMPFAPFTGINHHKQSTLFGCALLADETKETFVWLFEKWLECMGGKAPKSIITDQDGQIRDAIREVFPETHHRFCSWHIGKNAAIHLKQFSCIEGFDNDYKSWVYAATPKECDDQWEKMKKKYDIRDGCWLDQMYVVRHNWIGAYLKDFFFFGMTSSQHSESMNAFFDGYVNAQTLVYEFVKQYEKALCARRQQESLEDYKTIHSKGTMFIGDKLEQDARCVYTRKMFDILKEQYKQAMLYSCEKYEDGEVVTVYKLAKKDTPERYHLICFECLPEISMKCSCKKFEGEGILYRHILRLMFQMNMITIPEKYILFRWTIMARYGSGVTLHSTVENLPSVTPYMMFSYQCATNKISTSISKSTHLWNHAMPVLQKLVEELDVMSLAEETKENDIGGAIEVSTLSATEIMLVDPSKKVTKGRPRGTERIKSGVEISQASQKKKNVKLKVKSKVMKPTQKRHCGNCGMEGHYSTTCSAQQEEWSRMMTFLNENCESEEEEDVDRDEEESECVQ